jgi:hypothetical protein
MHPHDPSDRSPRQKSLAARRRLQGLGRGTFVDFLLLSLSIK